MYNRGGNYIKKPPANSNAKNFGAGTKKQVVAGFVIYRRTEEGVKFLLLYRRGSYWNFPKGHFEAGETSFTTALRETEEETGIVKSDLRIDPNFRAYEQFNFMADGERIHDTVILYLAETKRVEIKIIPREHSGYAWFSYRDAMKTIGSRYMATKRVLKKANDFVQGQSFKNHRPHPKGFRSRLRRGGAPSRQAPPAWLKPLRRGEGPRGESGRAHS